MKEKDFIDLAAEAGVSVDLFGNFRPKVKFWEENWDSKKPTVLYIHTGGTLAMVRSKKHEGAVSFEGAIDIPKMMEVCDIAYGVRDHYNLIGLYLANEDSAQIKSDLWIAISAAIRVFYDQIDGVVVGHGTHTWEYSSAAVAYSLRNLHIPVVFTASQIPAIGYPGSDGLLNLTGAMEIAANGDIAEVVAYASGQIHRGTRFTKKSDKRLDVIESRVTGPIGYFTASGIELMPGVRRRAGKRKIELLFEPGFHTSVVTEKLNPGINPTDFGGRITVSENAVAMIVECYGSGALPKDLVPVMSKHIKKGFPILTTSSCGESGISSAMENHDEDAIAVFKAGIQSALDMTTSAASVKLMHIMAQEDLPKSPQDRLSYVRREMRDKSYAGEVSLSGIVDF